MGSRRGKEGSAFRQAQAFMNNDDCLFNIQITDFNIKISNFNIKIAD